MSQKWVKEGETNFRKLSMMDCVSCLNKKAPNFILYSSYIFYFSFWILHSAFSTKNWAIWLTQRRKGFPSKFYRPNKSRFFDKTTHSVKMYGYVDPIEAVWLSFFCIILLRHKLTLLFLCSISWIFSFVTKKLFDWNCKGGI